MESVKIQMRDRVARLCRKAAVHPVWSILLAVELVVIVLGLGGLFRPLTGYQVPAAQMQNLEEGILLLEEDPQGTVGYASGQDQAFADLLAENEQDGVPMAAAQGLRLPRGRYTIEVEYSASAQYASETAGSCRLWAEDAELICPGIDFKADENWATVTAWMKNETDVGMVAVYAKSESLRISMVSIQEDWIWRLTDFLRTVVLFAVVDAVAMMAFPGTRFALSRKGRMALLVVVGTVLLSSIPALSGFASYGFDLEFHLSRISGIAEGLRSGQFPVRIYPDFMDGYGYASPIFYGDIFLYFPAVLCLAGLPLYEAYNIHIVTMNLATALISLWCFDRMFRSRPAALAGMVLYTTAAYRIFNVYYRPALGECSAQTFLPLIAYGFWALYSDGASEKQRRGAWLPLMLGFTGVIQTHVITTEISALGAVAVVIVCARKAFRPERLRILLEGAVGTVLLNLWFLVPFLTYMQGDYACTQTDGIFNMDANKISLSNLFKLWDQDMSAIRLGAGLLAGCALYLIARALWRNVPRATGRLGTACLIGAAVTVYLVSVFHWGSLSDMVGETLAHYLCAVQFPFRYLTLTVLLLTITAASAVAIVHAKAGTRLACICAVILIAASGGSAWADTAPYADGSYGKVTRSQNSEFSDARETSGLEYLPVAFSADPNDQTIHADDGVQHSAQSRSGVSYCLEASNSNDTPAALVLPLTYYPDYRVTDNTGGEISLTMSDKSTVQVVLSAGYEGTFTVNFVPRRSWRLAEAVSLLFALVLIVRGVLKRTGRKKERV